MKVGEPAPAWSDGAGAAVVVATFRAAYDETPDGVWAAPGRVNLIGEHLDYNAGPGLPIALPHRTFIALRRRDDDTVRVVSGMTPDQIWSGTLADIAPGSVHSWVAYALGPAWTLAEEGFAIGGFDAAIESCVPVGAGLSSSAAIECAVAVALDDVFGLGQVALGDAGRARLAQACVRAENDVVGAPTGGMDQAASLRARAGHALLLDSRDGSARQVPFDLGSAGFELLVIDTRAPHALVDGQYAARRQGCQDAAAALGVEHLVDVTDPDAAGALHDPVLGGLVRHVVTETARVHDFVDLIELNDLRSTGPLLTASHVSLRDDYRVSCPELDVAVDAALTAGALGARMTGGGFGGSAIALTPADFAGAVRRAVAAAFSERGWTEPQIHLATAAAGAGRVPGPAPGHPA